ncbi:MAG: FadR/GntR family transcriptional regulator [Eubacteriales bacterium]|nr:FadR/GntR family transcriptional regulator [Eubacteriales bacterium]
MEEFAPKKLYEQVFEQIKEQIRRGDYKKGDVLPSEKDFVETMGVSRVTVRQALSRLSEAGIIKTYKGKGSVVAVDWRSVLEERESRTEAESYMAQFEHTTRARRILEPAIARQAALSAGDEDIERLRQALTLENGHELPGEGGAGRTEGLPDFHRCVAACLNNPVMSRLLEELIEQSALPGSMPLIPPTRQKQHREETIRQHRNIFEAIKNHDPDYAYYHMLVHCDWIYETYEEYFRDFLK